jgi:hypothetical protein
VHLTSDTLTIELSGAGNIQADAIRLQRIVGHGGEDNDFHVAAASATIDAGLLASAYNAEPTPNGLRINLGHTGNSPEATTSASQLVQVLSPNGLEKLEHGQTVSVTWRTIGIVDPRGYYNDVINADQPAAYYRLGEPGGATIAVDASSNNHPGSYVNPNGYTQGLPGAMPAEADSSVSFNSNGYVTVPDSAALRPSLLTVEAWINPDLASSGYATVLMKTTNTGWGDGYGLLRPASGDKLRFFVNNWSGPSTVEADVPKNQWSHVAGTYDGSALKLYVNGVLVASTNYSAPINHSLQPLLIGAGQGGYYWRGLLDEVAIYPTALSAAQIAAHYQRGTRAVYGTVNIDLVLPGSNTPVMSVAQQAPNNGMFSWTVPASIAEGNYQLRVQANEGNLPVDASDGSFVIANNGNQYYVNDASLAGDVFTTAIGNNANSGKSPSQPMASLAALLFAYDLDAGDVVHVDTGAYTLLKNVVLDATESGVCIEGPGAVPGAPAGSLATLDRGNTAAGSYAIQFTGADDVTLDYLTITGAEHGIYMNDSSESERNVITHSILRDNARLGVYVGYYNDDTRIETNQLFRNRGGGISAWYVIGMSIRDNELYFNNTPGFGGTGITIRGANVPTGVDYVVNNHVYGSDLGISAGTETTLVYVQDNRVHHNYSGITISGNTIAERNETFANQGYHWSIGYGLAVGTGSVARDNVTYDNDRGIDVGSGTAINNRVFYNRDSGIQASSGARVLNNEVYSNGLGVVVSSFSGRIANNLIYDNRNASIYHGGGGGVIENNTVYHTGTGDALQLGGVNPNYTFNPSPVAGLTLRNNIVVASTGFALRINPDSELNFASDYNAFYLQGAGQLIRWEDYTFTNLADWFYETSYDQHSFLADPEFIDINGADDILGALNQRGLTASYYAGTELAGAPLLTRVEPNIDTNFPANTTAGLPTDQFSVRWTGYVYVPWTGDWTFYSAADDGERFYLDGQLRIDQWTWDNGVEQSTTIAGLTKGWHEIRYEMSETIGNQYASLRWSGPNIGKGVIPTQYLARAPIDIIDLDFGGDDNFQVAATSPTIDAGDPTQRVLYESTPSGGRINLGHTGNTSYAALSPAQTVQVLSPSGLDKFEQGQTIDLTWNSYGIYGPSSYYAGRILQDAPLAYYRLGDTTGDTVLDSSPQALHGVFNGGERTTFDGALHSDGDRALDFDGVNDYVRLPSGFADFTGGFSAELWAYPTSAGYYQRFFELGNGPASDNIILNRESTSNTLAFYILRGGSQVGVVRVNEAIELNKWQYFAVTMNAAGNIVIYKNGNVIGVGQSTLPLNVVRTGNYLGKSNGTDALYAGGLDEVAFYNTALSADTIRAHYERRAYGDVALSLVNDVSGAETVITSSTLNTGRFTYTIPMALAEGSYRLKVTSNVGAGVSNLSPSTFVIANNGAHYYVNDGQLTGDVFSSASGDNHNTGKNPDQPMSSLRALLQAYDLDAGDVIHVDAGTYRLYRSVLLSPEDSGVRIEGPGAVAQGQILQSVATLNRGNTNTQIYAITFTGADDVSIDHLAITGGEYGIVADAVDSDRLTFTNNDIFGNLVTGIYIARTNDDVLISQNRLHNHLGNYSSAGASVLGARARIEKNELFGNVYGVYADYSGNVTDRIVIDRNVAHDNTTIGISARNGVLVTENIAFGHLSGIGIEAVSNYQPSEVFRNVAYNNAVGIDAVSVNQVPQTVAYNRVYLNTRGIRAQGVTTIDSNQSYSNTIGIAGHASSGFFGTLINNVVYANTSQGIFIERSFGVGGKIFNNTVYQSTGEAIRLENVSQGMTLRNNILWVDSGYAIYVAPNSQSNISSNYNLVQVGTGAANVGFWGSVARATLADWQTATSQDAQSLVGDPLWVDRNGADNTLGYTTYDGGLDDNFHLRGGSPAIDRALGDVAPPSDRDANTRQDDLGTPNAGAPANLAYVDIGAYEFQGSSLDTTGPLLLEAGIRRRPTDATIVDVRLIFSEALDPIDASAPGNYELREAGVDQILGTTDDVLLTLAPHYTPGETTVILEVLSTGVDLGTQKFSLIVRGTTSIHDLAGNKLDGDNDGQPGGDFVGVNKAPAIVSPPDFSIDEGATLSLLVSASDAEDSTLTYVLGAGAPPGATLDPNTGQFSWTPAEEDAPFTYNFTIEVFDQGIPQLSAIGHFVVHALEVNNAPVITTIGPQDAVEHTEFELTPGVNDPEGNTITFSLAAGFPDGMTIDPLTGTVRWTPPESAGGQNFDITLIATDDGTPNAVAQQSFTLQVAEFDDLPVVNPPTQLVVNELAQLSYQLSASDPDNEALAFSFVGGAPLGLAIDPLTGQITWTPTEAQGPGVYPIVIRVSDAGPHVGSVDVPLSIQVFEVNVAPQLAPVADRQVRANQSLAFTVMATDADLPVNILSYAFVGSVPAGLSLNSSTGEVSWQPSEAQIGVYALTIQASDNGSPVLADTLTFEIEVAPSNSAPSALTVDVQPLPENAAGAIVGAVHVEDVDIGDTHTFSVSDARFEVVNAVLQLKAGQSLDYEEQSQVSLTVTATDTGGLSIEQMIVIPVEDLGEVPTDLSLSRNQVFHSLAGAWIAAIRITDPDQNNNYTYLLSDSRFEIVDGGLYLKLGQEVNASEATVALQITVVDVAAGANLLRDVVLQTEPPPAVWEFSHQWAKNPFDVNADGFVTPLDAVLIVNQINAFGPYEIPHTTMPGRAPAPFFDVSGDWFVAPSDAVVTTNYLNSVGAGKANGESIAKRSFAENVDVALLEEMLPTTDTPQQRNSAYDFYFWRCLEDSLDEICNSKDRTKTSLSAS